MKNIFKYIAENKLGVATLVLSLTFMFIGLPAQIYKIWISKSVNDISLPMFLLLSIQSLFWIMYGLQRKDRFVVVANFFGTLFACIIVLEYFIFR